MDIDEALYAVGGFRRWNLLAFAMLSISMFTPLCFQGLSIVFTGWPPPHHCTVPEGQFKNETIPYMVYKGEVMWDSCDMYANYSIDNTTVPCPDSWTYDSNGYETIVTEFSLVCEGNYLADMSQVIYQAACLLSECISSYLIDKWGRKKVHLTALFLVATFGTAAAFSPNYAVFVALRSVTGMFVVASLISGITMALEIFDSTRRSFAGIGLEAGWVSVYLLLPVLAFAIPDWRVLQVAISAMSFVWVIYIWILPESAAWLTAYERYDEAEGVLRQMARWNGVKGQENLKLHRPYKESDYIRDGKPRKSVVEVMAEEMQQAMKGVQVPVRQLFTDSKLRIHLALSGLFWFANCVVYYGLILSSPSLGQTRFLSFLYMGLVEIPAYIVAYIVVEKIGRRIPMMVFQLIAGVALLAVAFIPEETESGLYLEPLIITVALVAKFGITASFAILVLYTKELFPASLRGTSSGIYLACGRIGNMATPFAAYGARHIFWLPNFIFAIISIVAGFAVLVLPETLGKELPITTEDIHTIFYNKNYTKSKVNDIEDKKEAHELESKLNENSHMLSEKT